MKRTVKNVILIIVVLILANPFSYPLNIIDEILYKQDMVHTGYKKRPILVNRFTGKVEFIMMDKGWVKPDDREKAIYQHLYKMKNSPEILPANTNIQPIDAVVKNK